MCDECECKTGNDDIDEVFGISGFNCTEDSPWWNWIGDGQCDHALNVELCRFDGGNVINSYHTTFYFTCYNKCFQEIACLNNNFPGNEMHHFQCGLIMTVNNIIRNKLYGKMSSAKLLCFLIYELNFALAEQQRNNVCKVRDMAKSSPYVCISIGESYGL